MFAKTKESYRVSKERYAGLDYPLRTKPAVMEWEGHERESADHIPLDIILDARQDRIPQQPGPSRAARAVRKKSPKL